MRTFFDSSAFVKRYILEEGSQAVEELLQETTELGVSVIVAPELFSAFNRRRREQRLNDSDYIAIKAQLATDIDDANAVQLDNDVLARSIRLLEKHPLRGMDALHVACALQWRADLFVSSDQRQLTAAEAEALTIRQV